jgi:hypothetical protein
LEQNILSEEYNGKKEGNESKEKKNWNIGRPKICPGTHKTV